MKEHYVYLVIDSSNLNVKYVGKGKGDRYKHILSGTSNNYDANKAYHMGLTQDCEIFKLVEEVPDKFAQDLEKALIYALKPEWNSDHVNILPEVDCELLDRGFKLKTLIEYISKEGCKFNKSKIETFIGLAPWVLHGRLRKYDDDGLSRDQKVFLLLLPTIHKFLDTKFNDYMDNDEDWDKVNWSY